MYEAIKASHMMNNTTIINTNLKNKISQEIQNLELCMNCVIKNIDTSIQVPLKVEVQSETCFSDHSSMMLGEISPHHNYENQSSSETLPSYTQLSYNHNIERFFNSHFKTDSLEDLTNQNSPKEIAKEIVTCDRSDIKIIKAQQDTLLQRVIPNSSTFTNHLTENCSEQNSNKSNQQPLTQKVLLQHNKKMEDDLVKQHKNNTKKNKFYEKQKQDLPDKTKNIADLTYGVKRSSSSAFESNSFELNKKKCLINRDHTIVTQTQDKDEDTVAVTHTVARATQIWSPCQITRDSQTTSVLLVLYSIGYNLSYSV
uniref:Period circadian protein n=1 Tax=Sipha flava TaxID=143950 RepID=A0A2S2QT40_9HEMI